MRTLIAGVGYFNQGDLSAGPLLVPLLQQEAWPPQVEVEDLSYGPIAVVHRLQEAEPRHRRLVCLGAMHRGLPGAEVTCYRWHGVLPSPAEVQQRIGEALSGVVDLVNLLVIAQQFDALPPEVFVVEVQPVQLDHGLEPSPELAASFPALRRMVRYLAEAPSQELAGWPLGPPPLAPDHERN